MLFVHNRTSFLQVPVHSGRQSRGIQACCCSRGFTSKQSSKPDLNLCCPLPHADLNAATFVGVLDIVPNNTNVSYVLTIKFSSSLLS